MPADVVADGTLRLFEPELMPETLLMLPSITSLAAKDFDSWADFYGPNFYHGDNYTALTRWNLR
jgi:hypothetical protein